MIKNYAFFMLLLCSYGFSYGALQSSNQTASEQTPEEKIKKDVRARYTELKRQQDLTVQARNLTKSLAKDCGLTMYIYGTLRLAAHLVCPGSWQAQVAIEALSVGFCAGRSTHTATEACCKKPHAAQQAQVTLRAQWPEYFPKPNHIV